MAEAFLAEFERYSNQVPSSSLEYFQYFEAVKDVAKGGHLQLASLLAFDLSPNALRILSKLLKDLFTHKWTAFIEDYKIEIYRQLLKILATKGPTLFENDKLVISDICQLLARVIRQSWNETLEYQGIIGTVSEFLNQQSLSCKFIGIEILDHLVDDMSPKSEHAPLKHARISVQFREKNLPQIFQIAFSMIDTISDDTVTTKLLKLLSHILSYDKVEGQEKRVLQLGKNELWMNIIRSLPAKLMAIYTQSPHQTCCFEILGQAVKTNTSYFGSAEAKAAYLTEICNAILPHLQTQPPHHELWVLLSYLNAQVEVYTSPTYLQFATAVYECTLTALRTPSVSENSVMYLLEFWENSVGPVLTAKNGQLIDQIKTVTIAYIERKISTPFDSQDELVNSLVVVNSLARVDFLEIGSWCVQKFESSVQTQNVAEMIVMLYTIGVLIFQNKTILQRMMKSKQNKRGGLSLPEHEVTLEETVMNGDLSVRGLQVALNNTLPQAKEACITFITFFTKVYLNKQVSANVQGTFATMAQRLGLGHENEIVILVLRKVFEFLADPELYEKGAELLLDLVSQIRWVVVDSQNGFLLCGKLTFNEECAREILQQYVTGAFPFQQRFNQGKARITLHNALLRLYINIYRSNNFDDVLVPASQLAQVATQNPEHCLALLYDATGFAQSIIEMKYFDVLFTWCVNNLFPITEAVLSSQNELVSPVLTLLCNLVDDRLHRINKSTKSSLHKIVASQIERYISVVMTLENNYDSKYKPLGKAIKCLTDIITDHDRVSQCIQQVESMTHVITTLPLEEITEFSKVFERVFYFLEHISDKKFNIFLKMSSEQVSKVLTIIGEGCQSFQFAIQILSYTAIYQIAEKIAKEYGKYQTLLQANEKEFRTLLKILMTVLVNGEQVNQSNLGRAIYSLININQEYYIKELVEQLSLNFGEENYATVKQSLINGLFEGVNFKWDNSEALSTNLGYYGSFETKLNSFTARLRQ